MRFLAPVALVTVALLAGGCGGKVVSKDGVAKQMKDALATRGYTAPVKSATCPKDLDAKVGATETCTLTYKSGHAFAVSATVSSVSGSTAHLDYKVTKRLK